MKKTLRDIDNFFNGKKRKLALIGGALILVGAIATSEPIPESEYNDSLNTQEELEVTIEEYKEQSAALNEKPEESVEPASAPVEEEVSPIKEVKVFAEGVVDNIKDSGGVFYAGYEIIGDIIIIQYNIGLYELLEGGVITQAFTSEQWDEVRNMAEELGKIYFETMEYSNIKGYNLELRCGNYSEDVTGLNKRTVLTVRNGKITYDAVIEQFN